MMRVSPLKQAHDVIVIGAGVVGLACAWRLARRGLSVLVLERARPGAGASGVAAGMLAPVTEADFGEQDLLALNLVAAAGWPAFAAELEQASGLPIGYRKSGALVVAADRDDAEELARLHAFQTSLGLEVEWLSGSGARRLEPSLSPRVAGAIHAVADHSVDPSAVVEALGAALVAEGGEIHCGADVASPAVHEGRVTGVRMRSGEIAEAGAVVVAAGCWSGALGGVPEEERPPVRPVKGQILSLRRPPHASGLGAAAPTLAERIVRTPRCYVVDRGDGRVVVGATVEERGFDTSVTAGGVFELLEAAREVLPDVVELEWVGARAGLRPGTPDNAPVIGPGALAGLVWATGHHRNGVLLAPVTAEAVARLLVEGELPERVRPFDPARFARSPAGSAR